MIPLAGQGANAYDTITRPAPNLAVALPLPDRLPADLLSRRPDILAARGFSTTVADARFAKPLDADLILRLAREHEVLITVEEGSVGGFGAFVLHLLAEHGALDRGLKARTLTLPDVFQEHDKPEAQYALAGIDTDGIVRTALRALGVEANAKGIRGLA